MKSTLFILLVCIYSVSAQNLVIDGSFHTLDTTHSATNIEDKLLHWQQLNVQLPLGQYLKHTQEDSSSTIELGYHYFPITGEYHCFYAVGKLQEMLLKNKVYEVEMRVKLAPNSEISSNDLGVGFMEKRLPHSPNKLLKIPHVNLSSEVVKSKEFITISGLYIANGNEKFIVLGQFLPPSKRLYSVEKYGISTKNIAKVGKVVPWSHIKKHDFQTIYRADEVSVNLSSTQFIDDFTNSEIELKDTKLFRKIYFEVNSNKITPESYGFIEELSKKILENDFKRIQIIGHTDSDGESSYNIGLSRARAISIAQFLVKKGVNKEILTVLGKGEENPISSNNSPEGKLLNRRVEIIFE